MNSMLIMYAFWILPKEAFHFLVQIWKEINKIVPNFFRLYKNEPNLFLLFFFSNFSIEFSTLVHSDICMGGVPSVHAFYIRVQAFVKHSDLLSNCPFALKSQNTKRMHFYM